MANGNNLTHLPIDIRFFFIFHSIRKNKNCKTIFYFDTTTRYGQEEG